LQPVKEDAARPPPASSPRYNSDLPKSLERERGATAAKASERASAASARVGRMAVTKCLLVVVARERFFRGSA